MVPDKCFSSLQAVSFTVPSNTAQRPSRTLCSPAARSHSTSFGVYILSKEPVAVMTKWEKNSSSLGIGTVSTACIYRKSLRPFYGVAGGEIKDIQEFCASIIGKKDRYFWSNMNTHILVSYHFWDKVLFLNQRSPLCHTIPMSLKSKHDRNADLYHVSNRCLNSF